MPSSGASDDVEPTRDARAARDEEHVGVREVVARASSGRTPCAQRYRRQRGTRGLREGFRLVWRDRARCACAHGRSPAEKSSINGESGRAAVSSQLTGSGSDETTAGEYGANEWLVDEMYEKYLADKIGRQDLVARSRAYRPVDTEALGDPARSRRPEAAAPPRPDAGQPAARSAPADAGPRSNARPRRRRRPLRPSRIRPGHRPDPGDRRAARRPHHLGGPPHRSRAGRRAVTSPQPLCSRRPPQKRTRSSPCAACPRPSPRTWTRSLTVPTATSVRTIPAKLMIDNRIVINNHLAAPRGGKVSLHAPDRLGADPGAQGVPEPERLLRRGRRQARGGDARAHRPRHRDRPAQARRHAARSSCPRSSAPRR